MSVHEPRDHYLSPAEAKRFYDRLGSAQDWQGFYENPAINELIAHAAFDSAHSAFDPQRTAFPAMTSSARRESRI